jgi:hypothetical protein
VSLFPFQIRHPNERYGGTLSGAWIPCGSDPLFTREWCACLVGVRPSTLVYQLGRAVRLSAAVPSKILPLYHFLRHIINILSPASLSPAAVPPKLFPYTPLQHKISFSIHTFHLLLIFLLLKIKSGPRSTHTRTRGGEKRTST